MKSIINIASRVLLAYFMVLPILFSCHALLHDHHNQNQQSTGIEVSQITDCLLCDLYHDQSGTITHVAPEFAVEYADLIALGNFSDPSIAVQRTLHLRGPPTRIS